MSRPPAPAAGVLWDTMFASRLRPQRRWLLDAALAARGTRLEPLLCAPVVQEVVYGLWRRASREPEFAAQAEWWEERIVLGPKRLRIVSPGRQASLVAARIRAEMPLPPPQPNRRGAQRSKLDRRVSWIRDIELAAIGFTAGLPIATENRADFEPIGEVIATLWPAEGELVLQDEPGGGLAT